MKVFKRERLVLFSIILVALIVRALFIWIGRPEFVGWFNHTYYYFVQTREVLTEGKLAFADVPLLFYLYALSSKLLMWMGLEMEVAIVNASRFWMCVVPALIPIPVFFLAKNIHGQQALTIRHWILVGVSAFLPLSMLHLPEFSQKNMLGILLMAAIFWYSKKALDSLRRGPIGMVLLLFLLVVLTHFGTAVVALLFVLSLLLAHLIEQNRKGPIFALGGLSMLAGLLFLALIYWFDAQRFDRIRYYLRESFDASFLGNFFSSAAAVAGVLAPLMIFLFLWRDYRKRTNRLEVADQRFWLSSILFAYLLALPVIDPLVLARFSLFLSLPFLVILFYLLDYSGWKNWLKNGVVILAGLGALMLLFGEWMSLQMQDRNKEAVYEDLMEMDQQISFSSNDLVLTKNGAEHICNWFLETKAGMITSMNKKDFNTYDNIYILNPIQGQLNFTDIQGKTATNEADRYLFMMRNIPQPENAVKLYETQYMELLKIDSPPEEWIYDSEGYWISYGQ
jgi:hypothetical protein